MSTNSKTDQRWDNAHFTLANIPFGIASTTERGNKGIVTRVYDSVYFLHDLVDAGLFSGLDKETVDAISNQSTLNTFAALPKTVHRDVRRQLQGIFAEKNGTTAAPASQFDMLKSMRYAVDGVTLHVPVSIGDFSDFSCSTDHALNCGEAVLGIRELPPGFLHFPVGYTGRTSSIVPSGTPILRPWGQTKSRETGEVNFGPSKAVDFELEVAAVVSQPTKLGQQIDIANADDYIFGLLLLNDWSARDIQGFEMNPLGPFNGKSFGTTLSPWIVTLDALEAFECAAPEPKVPRAAYLRDPKKNAHYGIQLQVDLFPGDSNEAVTVCKSRLDWLYYTLRDLVAHQTVNGCPLRTGDLLATGTISGPAQGTHGCLLETTKGGKLPLKISDAESRVYLKDGDSVRLTAWAGELGSEDCVGFGEAFGTLLAANK